MQYEIEEQARPRKKEETPNSAAKVAAPSPDFVPLRNTLAAAGVSVGYDKLADAPIVGGQLLNKNDSRLKKVGDDYYIQKDFAKSFMPKAYENPYKDRITSLLDSLTNSHFSYDPAKDASLAAAQEEAMLAAKQAANSRGLLGGSTAEIMRQRAAQSLVPQYEQMAYNRYQNDRAAKLNTLSLLDALSDNAFAEYKGVASLADSQKQLALDAQAAADNAAYKAESLAVQKEENAQNAAAKSFANQLSKVLAMGSVDAEAAAVLGLSEGMLTAEQLQFMAKLEAASQSEQAKLAAEKAEKDLSWEREKELLRLETDEKIRAALAVK